MAEGEIKDQEKKGFEIGPAIELLKSLGVIAGSLGSIAALFFWIGNAIIVARLRAYNLYGVVHYTDEYVKEAGYQFFQDIFTFYQRWELIFLFILAIGLVFLLIPVGPFSSGLRPAITVNNRILKRTLEFIFRMRDKGVHYVLFLALAISTSISLTSDYGVRNLSENILRQERVLKDIFDIAKNNRLIFTLERKPGIHDDEFRQKFYEKLTTGEAPSSVWLLQALCDAYPLETCDYSAAVDKDFLLKQTDKFQKELGLNESPDVIFNDNFRDTRTYKTLLNIRLSGKLNKMIADGVESTLSCLWTHLSRHLTYKEDFSSLVVNPSNYEKVNEQIKDLRILHKNIMACFKPVNSESIRVMSALSGIRPVHFGSVLMSFSFWVLIGLLVYLFVNMPRIIRFKNWEKGYFFLMLLLFLTILVTLPSAYGRYNFEFKIQKLNDIIFTGDNKSDDAANPIKKKLKELWARNANLYILGPTKGKEVIVGAIEPGPNSADTSPRILMLDRETYRFIDVEPVRAEDIPCIIRNLQQKPYTDAITGGVK
jgi:hypothetical protein